MDGGAAMWRERDEAYGKLGGKSMVSSEKKTGLNRKKSIFLS